MAIILKKNIAFPILLIILLAGAFSCEDFLDEAPLSQLTVDQTYNTDDDLEQAVAGIYANLSSFGMYRRNRLQYFLELRTDAMTLGTTRRQGERLEAATYNYNAANGFIQSMWDTHYNGINNANVLIEKVPEANAATEFGRNRALAEAHFLRAFFYFNLVRLWGEVPLILESPRTYDQTREATRTPVEAIYEQIILDARTAAGEVDSKIVLPVNTNNNGRLTLSAAHTFLSEVYLTLELYSESAEYAKKVIDSGQHALWENYGDAFDPFKQYDANTAPNAESVFEIKFYQEIDPGSRFAAEAWPRGLVFPYAAQARRVGDGFMEVHESTYNRLDDNDARKQYLFPTTYALGTGNDAILVPDEDTIKGGPYDGLAFNREPPYFCIKYPLLDPLLRFGWAQNPWPVYRYADVLLYYVEAMNEQGLADQTVLDQTINLTRARGGLDPLAGLGQEELRQAIRDERFIEFFYEGERFFDLVRWDQLEEVVNNRDFGYSNPVVINENFRLLPLPQREFDANPNLGQNNPPWN